MQKLVWGRSSIEVARSGCHLMSLVRKFSTKLSAKPVSTATAAVQSSAPPQTPWLMLPSGWVDDDDSNSYHFFSVAEKKVKTIKKNFEIPWRRHYFYPEDDIVCLTTSCYGWQAFVNKRNCNTFLFNPLGDPLKFSHTIIPLPPMETQYDIFSSFHTQKIISTTATTESLNVDSQYKFLGCKVYSSPEDMIDGLMPKIVFSVPPLTTTSNYNEDCLLMASTGGRYTFCRPGDTSWTSLDFVGTNDHDFTYFSKDQLFYLLNRLGQLESLDLRKPNSSKMRCRVYNRFPPIIQPTMMDEHQIKLRERSFKDYHLVDSSGDLLLVVRSTWEEYTVAFDVYKFDFANKKWVYVPDLGDDRVLFLGLNSFSMSLSDNPGLQGSIRGNCIYFSFGNDMDYEPTYNDSGIYNLNDGSITRFLPECFLSKENQIQSFPPPTWIHPRN